MNKGWQDEQEVKKKVNRGKCAVFTIEFLVVRAATHKHMDAYIQSQAVQLSLYMDGGISNGI